MEEKSVEVKQVSEREIWIGEHRLYLGEDNILYVTSVGEIDDEIAVGFKEAILKLGNMVEGKMNVINDLNKGGKTSPGARKLFKGLSEYQKLGKVALWGLHPVARVLGAFAMGISKKKDFRFFKTKEEALAWLKQ